MTDTPLGYLMHAVKLHNFKLSLTLKRVSGTAHYPLFEYDISVGPVFAIGKGPSKQMARHDAALNALHWLMEFGHISREPLPSMPDYCYDNYINMVAYYCSRNSLTAPTFLFHQETGPTHSKRFTFRCLVGVIICDATASKKRIAKQFAARKMFYKLVILFQSAVHVNLPGNTEEEYRDEALMAVYLPITTFHVFMLQENTDRMRTEAHELLNNNELTPMEKLRYALFALNFVYEIRPVNGRREGEIGLVIRIFTDPVFEMLSFGDNYEVAEVYLGQKGVYFLQTLLN